MSCRGCRYSQNVSEQHHSIGVFHISEDVHGTGSVLYSAVLGDSATGKYLGCVEENETRVFARIARVVALTMLANFRRERVDKVPIDRSMMSLVLLTQKNLILH